MWIMEPTTSTALAGSKMGSHVSKDEIRVFLPAGV